MYADFVEQAADMCGNCGCVVMDHEVTTGSTKETSSASVTFVLPVLFVPVSTCFDKAIIETVDGC